jgi:hypothetical protein
MFLGFWLAQDALVAQAPDRPDRPDHCGPDAQGSWLLILLSHQCRGCQASV